MSHRYITPILALSLNSFLCSSIQAHSPSTQGAENFPPSSQNSSFCAPSPMGSRQSSHTFGDKNYPRLQRALSQRSLNTPLVSETPLENPQSELLDTLKQITLIQEIASQDNFKNLSEQQNLGLQYRNEKILEAINTMLLNDPALSMLHSHDRSIISTLMIEPIKAKLRSTPEIWGHFPSELKKQIITASREFYSSEDGWFRILESWITLEELASYASPITIKLRRTNSMRTCRSRVGFPND